MEARPSRRRPPDVAEPLVIGPAGVGDTLHRRAVETDLEAATARFTPDRRRRRRTATTGNHPARRHPGPSSSRPRRSLRRRDSCPGSDAKFAYSSVFGFSVPAGSRGLGRTATGPGRRGRARTNLPRVRPVVTVGNDGPGRRTGALLALRYRQMGLRAESGPEHHLAAAKWPCVGRRQCRATVVATNGRKD